MGHSYFHEKDGPKPVPFSILASLIRMGHKYTIPKLMDDALSRLKKCYPTSLSAWDDIATRARYGTVLPMDAFEAVRLARLTETPSILPWAFFTCCKNLKSSFAEGDSIKRHRFLEKLSVDDVGRLINGRGNLAQGIVARLSSLLIEYASLPSDYRSDHQSCQDKIISSIQALRTNNEQSVLFKNARYHAAFEPLSDWLCAKPGDRDLPQRMLQCEPCLEALKSCDEKIRMRVWSELPRYFNLERDGGRAHRSRECVVDFVRCI